MKTLAGWIAGVFALGLALGGLYRGTSAENVETSASTLSNLPMVDCGPGREVLYEPVLGVADGATMLRARCIPVEPVAPVEKEAMRPVAAPAAPAPVFVTVPVPAPAPAPPPAPTPVAAPAPAVAVPTAASRDANAERESRPWERSALIIGSSAGAGAGIGALAKGSKGAAVGAAIGGVAGTIYDLSTRNKK